MYGSKTGSKVNVFITSNKTVYNKCSTSYRNTIACLFNTYCVTAHKLSDLRRTFSGVIEATYALCPELHHHSKIFFSATFLLVTQTCNNYMELGKHHMRVCEKLKFQLPDCFSSSSRRMRLRIIVAQKKPLFNKPMSQMRIAGFSFDFGISLYHATETVVPF